jgi:ribonuclease HI
MDPMPKRLIAACDGACKGNPGPAAWAWVVADADENVVRWESGALGIATNNVAELTALQRLLASTDADDDLEIRMDSQYAMNAVTTWLPKWKKNGWKTAGNKPVANQELVASIDGLLSGRKVKFVYVPAHQIGGDRLNDLADRAASASAVSQRPARGTSADEVPEAIAKDNGKPGSGSSPTAKKKPSGPPAVIAAKFPGTCRCGKPYKAGEKIAKNPDGWGHAECVNG